MELSDLVKATANPYSSLCDEMIDVTGWIDTGSYALNALIGGSIFRGLPENAITGYGAESSTGKTFFALSSLKHFLDNDPRAIGMIFESEGAITKSMIAARGIDLKRVAIIPVATIQEFRTSILKVISAYESTKAADRQPMFFILDSLGMLSTTKEVEDTEAGSETKDMTRAALIKASFRVMTLRISRSRIPMVVTNHVYADIGGGPYAAPVWSGGSGGRYAASTIVAFSKARDKNKDGEVEGNIITATTIKSRFTREMLKVKCLLKYEGGLDRYYWMTELALAAGVFKKDSTRVVVADGRKVFAKSIKDNPEEYFTKEVLLQVDEWVKMNFQYVSSEPSEPIEENEDESDKE